MEKNTDIIGSKTVYDGLKYIIIEDIKTPSDITMSPNK